MAVEASVVGPNPGGKDVCVRRAGDAASYLLRALLAISVKHGRFRRALAPEQRQTAVRKVRAHEEVSAVGSIRTHGAVPDAARQAQATPNLAKETQETCA